ncbi:hypothetical protein [Bacillus sp. FJAT-27251]|uniref:hypothetical protein n=1 Tax=Bacillus sp. FJAT-27251 TaxID=1684142 RepID=UPI0012E1E33D|nr:hypothetical protein [Bacillus sp. FJAT-27251]
MAKMWYNSSSDYQAAAFLALITACKYAVVFNLPKRPLPNGTNDPIDALAEKR